MRLRPHGCRSLVHGFAIVRLESRPVSNPRLKGPLGEQINVNYYVYYDYFPLLAKHVNYPQGAVSGSHITHTFTPSAQGTR